MTFPLPRASQRAVGVFRRLLAQRYLATLVCLAALALRLLVPAGYMVASDHGAITVSICSGVMGAETHALTTAIAPGTHGGKQDGSHDAMPCPFSSHAAPALAALDPVLLGLLLAFILALGTSGVVLPLRAAPAYLRPPLRGPPAFL